MTAPSITNHTFNVAENASIGAAIGTVKASDNVGITYYLISTGNSNYAFSIHPNGQIKIIMKLDYDSISNYSLVVEVADAASNTSNAIITVNITDVDADPAVATLQAGGVKNNNVTLNGELISLGTNSDGSTRVNEYGFIYSTNSSQTTNLQLGKSGVTRIGEG